MKFAEWYQIAIQSDGIFNSHRTTLTDSFSCILFLWQLHLNFCMRYFNNITLLYLQFRSKLVRICSYLRYWDWNVWRNMTSKTNEMMSKRQPDIMNESHLKPPGIRRHFLALSVTQKFLSGMQERSYIPPRCSWAPSPPPLSPDCRYGTLLSEIQRKAKVILEVYLAVWIMWATAWQNQ